MLEGLEGKVALVTGAGRGLGRAHALALASQGVNIVVNDFGKTLAGDDESNPGQSVVDEIRAAGGESVLDSGDVADWDDAEAMVQRGVDEWGRFDILVNNAGFLRDRMIFNMNEADFDDVVRVHVKGHFCTARHASVHWRAASKAADGPVYARIINTASEAMLLGSPGQPNYASAKAAIVNLTLVIANSLARIGVNANAIAPRARTRMTEELGGFAAQEVVGGYDPLGAEHVAALVAYLASPAAERISGQLFVVYGRTISVVHGPFIERSFDVDPDVGPGVWTPESVSEQLTPFYADREPVTQGFTIQGDPRT